MTEPKRPKTEPIEKIKADILDGRYDGDIGDLLITIHEHILRNQTTQVRWAFTLDGETIREDDLTLGETAMVERFVGSDWGSFDPRVSAVNSRALLVSILHHRSGMTVNDAQAKVDQMNHAEFGETFTVYEVTQVPLDDGPG